MCTMYTLDCQSREGVRVPIIHDATVSGVGEEIWTADFNPTIMRCVVTTPAASEPLDLTPPARYLRIGWWAPLENFVSDPDYGTGICLLETSFIFALFQKVLLDPQLTIGGIDGFHYDLQPGVSVRFVWHD